MTRIIVLCLAVIVAAPGLCFAQAAGNLGFSQSGARARARQRESAKHVMSDNDKPPTATSMFVTADVLMNVKADEFVAVFGIAQEAETVAECGQKMDAVVKEFQESLKALKIADEDTYLDFISQTKTYGFEITGDVAREKLVGFELKKNLAVHFKDRDMIDTLVVAAAKSKIYDLIKVDYVVNDVSDVQDKLLEEAAKTIKHKLARNERLLGIKVQGSAQVYTERSAAHYPTDMYDSFTAAESEAIGAQPNRQKFAVQTARKGRTFVFNGLDSDGFDQVINPVVIEPVVQFTLHLKMKYEIEQPKSK